jgi:hypothetical protein
MGGDGWVGHEHIDEALHELADEATQQRRWTAWEGPEISSLAEAICRLYDDSALVLALEAGRDVYGSRIDQMLRDLEVVLKRIDARRPPDDILQDPLLARVRGDAAAIRQAIAARQLVGWIVGFVDGTDTSLQAAHEMEGIVLEHFTDEDWFDEASLALAQYAPGGGEHLYDQADLAEVLNDVKATIEGT